MVWGIACIYVFYPGILWLGFLGNVIIKTNMFVNGCFCLCLNFVYYYWEFFTSALADGFSLEFKWQQVSSSLLGSSQYLNNTVVWMVSPRPPISKSFSPWYYPSVTVPRAPITMGIIITFMFLSCFNSLARSRYLSFRSLSVNYILWSAGTAKSSIMQVLFFLLIIIKSGRLAEIRWSVFISESQRSLYVSFCRTEARLCIYHLFVWSNLNFLYNSQWITLSIQSSLVLYSFYANLLHLFIMCWSFRLYHCKTYICCFVASYLFFDKISPYGVVLCCY